MVDGHPERTTAPPRSGRRLVRRLLVATVALGGVALAVLALVTPLPAELRDAPEGSSTPAALQSRARHARGRAQPAEVIISARIVERLAHRSARGGSARARRVPIAVHAKRSLHLQASAYLADRHALEVLLIDRGDRRVRVRLTTPPAHSVTVRRVDAASVRSGRAASRLAAQPAAAGRARPIVVATAEDGSSQVQVAVGPAGGALVSLRLR